MITVEINLCSAQTDEQTPLGLMIIDLQDTHDNGKLGDYRCRMYRKGTEIIKNKGYGYHFNKDNPKPIREVMIIGHRRMAEPVHNLVAKALKEMGYQ